MKESHFDPLMGVGSGAGLIFGNTGGVMEAAVRSAYYFVTGNEPPADLLDLQAVRGLEGIKRATVNIPGAGDIKVVVAHGLGNARKLCEEVRAGKADFHFLEVMACPGGCISGGGQPRTSVPPQDWVRQARIDSMYAKDASYQLRNSHDNPEIQALYRWVTGRISCCTPPIIPVLSTSSPRKSMKTASYWNKAALATPSKTTFFMVNVPMAASFSSDAAIFSVLHLSVSGKAAPLS